jgi:hypothetical protein
LYRYTAATHKSGYVDYIRQSRSKRVHSEKMRTHVSSDPNDPTSLGLDRQSGLRDPGPRLPDPSEPLWLDSSEAAHKHTYIRPRNRPQYLSDEAELGLSQFREAPTTAAEVKECARVLIPKVGGRLYKLPARDRFLAGAIFCLVESNPVGP